MINVESVDHLAAEAQDVIGLDAEQRIRVVWEDRWIEYPRASQLLNILGDVLARPRTTRMPSVAIYADSGMGKTMLLQQFLALNRTSYDTKTASERTPVIALQMASKPNEKRFYSQILDVLGAPPGNRLGLSDIEILALRVLRHVNAKMLLIDEAHNILAATYSEQRAMLNLIRFLSNELHMSIVSFGVTDTREAISVDAQLARRFKEYPLPRWQADEEFQMLVVKILRNFPLRRPSKLSPRALKHLLQICDGVTAHIFTTLQEAAVLAIRTEQEFIDDALLNKVEAPSAAEIHYA